MRRLCLLSLFLLLLSPSIFAQFIGFEGKNIPTDFRTQKGGKLHLSSWYYKEGKQSLQWDFLPGSILNVKVKPFVLDEKNGDASGITLWIYNENPCQDSLRFEFVNPKGEVTHWFSFHLRAAGWRACWIAFEHMQGKRQDKTIAGYRLVAPHRKGRIFLDRLTFPVDRINLRTTPDEQMPTNNNLKGRDLWHWCLVWKWEQYRYDLPLMPTLTPHQKKQFAVIEQRLTDFLQIKEPPMAIIRKAYQIFSKAAIYPSVAGTGFIGAPLVAPDELNRQAGELSLSDIESMLSGFAYDACYNQNEEAEKKYFLVFEYAMDQGFAFGSGMGTNHHYGYQIRKIYTTAWLMRNAIFRYSNRDAILATLRFWAALQETRQPCSYGRDELLDSWHTLLMPKLISALLIPIEKEKERALRGLSRWLSTSLEYTPGTIGGIKVDGTTFHHGGFYPSYTIGVLATIGQYIAFTSATDYELTENARRHLKKAFLTMRNYCNLYEWGIGISGRHPFSGKMGQEDVESFARLSLAGDLSGKGDSFDRQLAADYLRLLGTKDTPSAQYFRQEGISPAPSPQGFFVYNYGSAGIFRRADWMVTLKGYNTDVWGAEIYAKDNRYGRYQSYGSVQIMGTGRPVSRAASGFVPEGWDWNRLPGTTTIHLPFHLLDSPLKGTTMAHSKENFSGSSSLEALNGMFAMKLMERNLKNFTSDFVARKSVFCFNNRLICLGTGITNSNTVYPTETTLFQCKYNGRTPQTSIDDYWLHDGYDNYYHVANGTVHSQVARQTSRHEKTKEETEGIFSSAWIDHGKAPSQASYEYLVVIQPTPAQLNRLQQTPSYQVLCQNDTAHIVFDKETGITAFAVFEEYHPSSTIFISEIPAETMLMYRPITKNIIRISVCDPNLNLSEKTYTTKESSQIIHKKVLLQDRWELTQMSERVSIEYKGGKTQLTVICQHGQPVEFELKNKGNRQ